MIQSMTIRRRSTKRSDGFTLVELLIVVAIIGMIAAIAIPNLINAVDKGKQKRTMADLHAIGTAVESYSVDHTYYPTASDSTALKATIDPVYIKAMPRVDGWAHPFQVDSAQLSYTLYSQGKDGSGTDCAAGQTSTFDDQICFSQGHFRRYPEGIQQ
jgi:general secretion pathway protein G